MSAWRRLTNYRPGRLGQNALLGTAGLGARALLQAVYLLIASRWLGAEGYGLFAGSVALVSLATPVTSWGSVLLLTRYIAQDRNCSRAMWATALVQVGVIGSLLVIGVLAISTMLLPQQLPLGPLLVLAVSELILLPASHAGSSHCTALERGRASAVSVCLVPLGRTLMLLGIMTNGLPATPEQAAWGHFGGTVLGLGAVLGLITWIDGPPAWKARLTLCEATRQGSAYAVSNVAASSYQEVDKMLMLQLLGAAVVGPYTVAFRLASIFVLPVSALITAILPRLLADGSLSNRSRIYDIVLLSALAYGMLAGLVILVATPLVPHLFGATYQETMLYMPLLSLWPALFAFRQCLAIRLTANQQQHLRSVCEVAGLVLVTALNLILLPYLGAMASVIALLTTEALVAIAFWTSLRKSHSGTQIKSID